MARSLGSLGALSICLVLAGCPGPETPPPGDTGGDFDAGMPIDAPGADVPAPMIDAPGADVPSPMLDAPPGMTDAPPSACLTGYPTLATTAFITGLSSPIAAVQAPGGTDWFVAERAGRIRVADSAGAVVGTFLDINARTGTPSGTDERGLLGLAFHPDYAANGLFYVMYTPTSGTAENVVAVGRRMTARVAEADVTPILRIPDFAPNHNGGCLQFGPDDELYVGTGDGGGGGDPRDNGQDNTQLLGKVLRIHVDDTTGSSYTIPAGNPFTAPNRPEIWATGLRNPWRFSFDRDTGDFWMVDVGQDTWEEVDFAAAGAGAGENYGWNDCEGFNRFGGASVCTLAGHHPPIVTARHGSDPVVGDAATTAGGYVYRGSAIPGLVGAYLWADSYVGWIAALRYCDGVVQEHQELDELRDSCPGGVGGPVSFAEDASGELYIVCLGGSVRRIVPG